jgi:serine/threonine-protein kinase HipA
MRQTEFIKVERADVYKGDRKAATLSRDHDAVVFAYETNYLAQSATPIATTLPLSDEPTRTPAGATPAFFANLLPEGQRLQSIVQSVRTSLDDELTLLLAIGRDTVGDVRVVPEGEDPNAPLDETAIVKSELDLEKLLDLANRYQPGIGIAGAQPKISDAMITYPGQTKHGPSIIKISPPHFPRLIENEHFFMKAAEISGIETAKTHLLPVGDQNALVVVRFDRTAGGRLAQEDGCQLLNRYPSGKYRITWRELADVIAETCPASVVEMSKLLSQVAFSFLVCNSDQHAKNVSVLWGPNGPQLSPLYDMTSALPYKGVERRMALPLDGRDNRLRRSDFVTFFGRKGVPSRAVESTLDRLLATVPKWIDQLDQIGFEEKTNAGMRREIETRAELLSSARDGA